MIKSNNYNSYYKRDSAKSIFIKSAKRNFYFSFKSNYFHQNLNNKTFSYYLNLNNIFYQFSK